MSSNKGYPRGSGSEARRPHRGLWVFTAVAAAATAAAALAGGMVGQGSAPTAAEQHSQQGEHDIDDQPSFRPVIEIPVNETLDAHAVKALKDGRVSPLEYRTAIVNVIACANNMGARIEPAVSDSSGVLLDYRVSNIDIQAFDDCYSRLGRAVDIAYQIQDTTRAAIDEYYTGVASCLEDRGIGVFELAESSLAARPTAELEAQLDIEEAVVLAVHSMVPSQQPIVDECT